MSVENESRRPAEGGRAEERHLVGVKKVEEEQTITRLHAEIWPADGEMSQPWGGEMYETEEKKVSRLQQERLNKSVCLKTLL